MGKGAAAGMHSFFGEKGVIRGEEAAHLFRVLRLRAGEEIVAIEDGRRCLARLSSVDKSEARYEPLSPLPDGEARLRVTLYQGLAKGERMEYAVQKCTELGVDTVVPVVMERSVARGGGAQFVERLSRIAREAVKQCGRSCVPRILQPLSFKEALPLMKKHEALFMPYERGGETLRGPLNVHSAGLLIGPEGGITEKEAQAVLEFGGRALTLGSRILRTETAGPAALTLLMYLGGEMEGGGETCGPSAS